MLRIGVSEDTDLGDVRGYDDLPLCRGREHTALLVARQVGVEREDL